MKWWVKHSVSKMVVSGSSWPTIIFISPYTWSSIWDSLGLLVTTFLQNSYAWSCNWDCFVPTMSNKAKLKKVKLSKPFFYTERKSLAHSDKQFQYAIKDIKKEEDEHDRYDRILYNAKLQNWSIFPWVKSRFLFPVRED